MSQIIVRSVLERIQMKLTQRKSVSRKQIGTLLAVAVIGLTGVRAYATDGVTNGGDNLGSGASYVNGILPDNNGYLIFDINNTSITGSYNFATAPSNSFGGWRVVNPAVDVTVNLSGTSTTIGFLGIDMTQATKNLTFSGGSLVLSNSQDWNIGGQSVMTVSGSKLFTFNSQITKSGTGSVVLTSSSSWGDNAFTQETFRLNNGVLQLGDQSASFSNIINVNSNQLIMSGGTLSLNGASGSSQTLQNFILDRGSSRIVTAANNNLTISSAPTANSNAQNGQVSSLVFDVGAGSVITWGSVGAQNILTDSQGNAVYRFGNTDFAATDSSSHVIAASYTALPASGASATTAYSFGASMAITASQTAGAIKFTGGAGSSLTLNTNVILQTGGILATGGNTLVIGGAGASTLTARATNPGSYAVLPIYVTGNGSVTINNTTIADNGTSRVALLKDGSGTLTILTSQSYSGGAYLFGGVLAIAGGSGLGADPASNTGYLYMDGGELDFLGTNSGSGNSRNVVIGEKGGIINVTQANQSFTVGTLTNATNNSFIGSTGPGVLTKTGAGIFGISRDNSNFGGTLRVTQGAVNFSQINTTAWNNSNAVINLAGGSLTGTPLLTVGSITLASGGVLNSNGTLTANLVSVTGNGSKIINNSPINASVSVNGFGQIAMTGGTITPSFGGSIVIGNNGLIANTGNSGLMGTVFVNAGGTLANTAASFIGNGSGSLVVSGLASTANNSAIGIPVFVNAGGSLTVTGTTINSQVNNFGTMNMAGNTVISSQVNNNGVFTMSAGSLTQGLTNNAQGIFNGNGAVTSGGLTMNANSIVNPGTSSTIGTLSLNSLTVNGGSVNYNMGGLVHDLITGANASTMQYFGPNSSSPLNVSALDATGANQFASSGTFTLISNISGLSNGTVLGVNGGVGNTIILANTSGSISSWKFQVVPNVTNASNSDIVLIETTSGAGTGHFWIGGTGGTNNYSTGSNWLGTPANNVGDVGVFGDPFDHMAASTTLVDLGNNVVTLGAAAIGQNGFVFTSGTIAISGATGGINQIDYMGNQGLTTVINSAVALSNNANVSISGGTLSLNGGVSGGSGIVEIAGAAANTRLIIGGPTSYAGSTTVSGGILEFTGNNASSASSSYSLGTGTTLLFTQTNALALGGPITGTGQVQITNGGTVSLPTGLSNYTGVTNVDNGRMLVNGGTLFASTVINVGSLTGQTGVFQMTGGTVRSVAAGQFASGFGLGMAANATGVLQISGGTLNVGNNGQLQVGGAVGGYASFDLSGGSVSVNNFFPIAQTNDNGIMNQTGGMMFIGTASGSLMTIANGGNAANTAVGVFNISGGTLTGTGARVSEGFGTAIVNVSGTGHANFQNGFMAFNGSGNNNNAAVGSGGQFSTGVINIGAVGAGGGTLTAGGIFKGANGIGLVNFHGGTLRAGGNQGSFININTATANGQGHVYVWSEGAVIDTNTFNDTVLNALEAVPSGTGVTSITIPSQHGLGYVGTPVVSLVGGGGVGATAVAQMSNGTITGIIITNPGIGYTQAPTVVIAGGTLATGTTAQASASIGSYALGGGFTKTGAGILTLAGADTYTGDTSVTGGSLVFSLPHGSYRNTILNGGGLVANGSLTTNGYLNIINGNMTIADNLINSFAGAGTVSSGIFNTGSGTTTLNNNLTINGGTVNLTGVLSYSGPTNVNNGGALNFATVSSTNSNALNINNGSINTLGQIGTVTVNGVMGSPTITGNVTLGLTGSATAGTLNMTSLALAASTTNRINIDVNNGVADKILLNNGTGAFTANGSAISVGFGLFQMPSGGLPNGSQLPFLVGANDQTGVFTFVGGGTSQQIEFQQFSIAQNASSAYLLVNGSVPATPATLYWGGSLAAGSAPPGLLLDGSTVTPTIWGGQTGVSTFATGTLTNWSTTRTLASNARNLPGLTTNVYFNGSLSSAALYNTTLGRNFEINSLNINPGTNLGGTLSNGTPIAGVIISGATLTLDGSDIGNTNQQPGFLGGSFSAFGSTTVDQAMIWLGKGGTISSTLALGNDQTWELDANAAKAVTISGGIIGAHALTLVGTRDVILSAASTYTGGTTISGIYGNFTVYAGNNTALSTGPVTVGSGATLDLSNGVANNNLTLTGGLNGDAAGVITASGTGNAALTLNQTVTSTFAGIIHGAAAMSVTKTGTGTVILTGANDYTGNTVVNQGHLVLGPGGKLFTGTGNGNQILVSNTANTIGYFDLTGGTISNVGATAFTINVANVDNSTGVFNMTGGGIITGNQTALANGANRSAYFNMSGGSINNGNWFVVGGVGANGNETAALNMTGGTLNISANQMTIGGQANAKIGSNMVNVAGTGVIMVTSANNGIFIGEGGYAVMTIADNAQVLTNTTGVINMTRNGTTENISVLNLNGGKLTVGSNNNSGIGRNNQGNGSNAVVNFNGGTLSSFGAENLIATVMDNVYVYENGAYIDTAGFTDTINKPLSSPDGLGIGTITVTGGTGYVPGSSPIVRVANGTGSLATGYAIIDASGNMTGIKLTNAGRGYTAGDNVTVSLVGGSIAGTVQPTFGVAFKTNVAGDLNKVGAGVLNLNLDESAFTGGYKSYGGTLLFSDATVLNNASPVNAVSGEVQINRTSDTVYQNPFSSGNGGTINLAGASKTTFANNNNMSGKLLVAGGNVQFGTGTSTGNVGSGTIVLSAGNNVTYNSTSAINGGGAITGNSTTSIIQAGPGVTTIGTATNNPLAGFTGHIQVSAGTLKLAELNPSVARQTPTVAVVLNASNLTLAANTSLDISNHDLIIHGGNFSTIEGLVASAFNPGIGDWSGFGITSSTAAAQGNTIGVGIAQDLGYGDGTLGTLLFDGVAVQPTDILVKYTTYGDADLNGVTNDDDYTLLQIGYGNTGVGWELGDFDRNGVVNDDDYTFIQIGYNPGGTPLGGLGGGLQVGGVAGPSIVAVPEPASLAVLGLAVVGLVAKRRRK